jgi:predicted nucleic acid-binding protein
VIYLDTSVIVPALWDRHPNFAHCNLLTNSPNVATSAHALAEAFKVLTGAYKLTNAFATTVLTDLTRAIHIEALSLDDYLDALSRTETQGIIGGAIYDSIHAAVARRLRVDRVLTYNLSDFRRVAPDLNIATP